MKNPSNWFQRKISIKRHLYTPDHCFLDPQDLSSKILQVRLQRTFAPKSKCKRTVTVKSIFFQINFLSLHRIRGEKNFNTKLFIATEFAGETWRKRRKGDVWERHVEQVVGEGRELTTAGVKI